LRRELTLPAASRGHQTGFDTPFVRSGIAHPDRRLS
jgi:hypothetical protein